MPEARPIDTDPAALELQVERLRAMSIAERAALLDRMCIDVEVLARAGILRDDPTLDEVGVLRELARRRYGSALADAAYGGVGGS